MFCVEGCGQKRGSHVSGLSAVPEGEGSQAAGSSSAGHVLVSSTEVGETTEMVAGLRKALGGKLTIY
jgi:hypothetical protein